MIVTQLANTVPEPQVVSDFIYIVDYDLTLSVPDLITAESVIQKQKNWGSSFNHNAAYLDVLAQYGGGHIGIIHGLTLSAGTGLVCEVAAGGGLIDGAVQLKNGGSVVVDASTNNYIWLQNDGAVVRQLTPSPPSTPSVFLGIAITDGSGVTDVDKSGVVYLLGGIPYRETADTSVPTDTPSSSWIGITKCANRSYLWNGAAYLPILSESALATYGASQFITNVTGGLTGTAAATNYLAPNGSAVSATETEVQIKVPKDCTLKNLRIYLTTVGVASGTGSIIVRKNGVDTAVLVNFTSGSSLGWNEDTTHSVNFSAGDLLSLKVLGATTGNFVFKTLTLDMLGR